MPFYLRPFLWNIWLGCSGEVMVLIVRHRLELKQQPPRPGKLSRRSTPDVKILRIR